MTPKEYEKWIKERIKEDSAQRMEKTSQTRGPFSQLSIGWTSYGEFAWAFVFATGLARSLGMSGFIPYLFAALPTIWIANKLLPTAGTILRLALWIVAIGLQFVGIIVFEFYG